MGTPSPASRNARAKSAKAPALPDVATVVSMAAAPVVKPTARPARPQGVGRLPAKIARARDALLAYFRPILTAHGLTDSQWRVLRVLSTTDEMDAGETAQRAFLLPSSLSRILKDFNQRGLIASWASPNDARRSMHALTKAGRKLVSDIEPHLVLVHRELERKIGVERLSALAEMLDAFSEDLES